MNENDKNLDSAEWLKDLPVHNELSAFTTGEMISCQKCGRKSPPNRAKCFYCSAQFDPDQIQTDKIKPNLRKLEAWENGFNLIYMETRREINEAEMREISKLLDLEKVFLKKLFENNESLPIARLESDAEAEIVKERLLQMGVETKIIGDEKLDLKKTVRRLRKIDFEGEMIKLNLFNTSEIIAVSREELSLLVSGSIYEKKTETLEKRVKSKENKTLNIDETAKDEKIIDIYTRNDSIGYRILTNGFDFSSLGNEMSFLAFENIGKIFAKLKEFAPQAKAAENYNQIRQLLSEIWEVEETSESRGVSKKGIGSFNLTKALTITNLTQFTKYSRLQRHLL